MKGLAYKFPRHIKLDIFPEDISKLKNGEILEYYNENCSNNDIPLLLFNVVKDNLSSQRTFTEEGFLVKYYPLGNPKDITTCWVKIDKSRFEELLKEDWIGTRHNGNDHLQIQIYKRIGE